MKPTLEPKPCVLCDKGKVLAFQIQEFPPAYVVTCMNCFLTGPMKETIDLAIGRWNEIYQFKEKLDET